MIFCCKKEVSRNNNLQVSEFDVEKKYFKEFC